MATVVAFSLTFCFPANAGTSDCSGGSLSGILSTDTEVSGNLCITGNLALRARLTLAPGTDVAICAGCNITVPSQRDGVLVAEGTAASPIVFRAADPTAPWGRLFLTWPVDPATVLRHAVIDDAGSGVEAALQINEGEGDPGPVPVVDQVTITNSRSNGLDVSTLGNDPTPPAITNITITGSAGTAVRTSPLGVSGFAGSWKLSGNGSDRIEVEGQIVSRDLIFRHLGYPYEILSTITIREPGAGISPARVAIEAGATLLLHPDTQFNVDASSDGKISLEIGGTAAAPVTFTRLDAGSAPWGTLDLRMASGAKATIEHAVFEYGGGLVSTGFTAGMIFHGGDNAVSLRNVTLREGLNAGVALGSGGALSVTDSRFENNRVGLRARAPAIIRRTVFSGNAEGAVDNRRASTACVDAIGNFWGAADGPLDTSSAQDACFSSAVNIGTGDEISDGVLYRPVLSAEPGPVKYLSGISPEPFWVAANGLDEAEITITARDSEGNPLRGKELRLETTLGEVFQPTLPTDGNGQAVATIRSTQEGVATLSARNLTDGVDLGAVAGVVFWSGGGETGGIIRPGGTPYRAPQLLIEGAPFEPGFPMTFRVPMRNANSGDVDVQITYGVSRLGIGAGFTEVGTVSRTLAPGEEWDAAFQWNPPSIGHRCVQARGTVTGPGIRAAYADESRGTSGLSVGPFRVNFDVPDDPCDDLDAGKLVPSGRPGLPAVVKHIGRTVVQAHLVGKCLSQGLDFRREYRGALRDFETVISPVTYTPPALTAGGEVDAAEAGAATAVGDIAARLSALDRAIATTRQRARAAALADGGAGEVGDDLPQNFDGPIVLQQTALRDFQLEYADELDALVLAVEQLLAVTRDEGDPDTIFDAVDVAIYAQELESIGYDQETIDFLRAFGLSDAEIDARRTKEISDLRSQASPVSFTFYEFLGAYRAAAAERASILRQRYGSSASARGVRVPMSTSRLDELQTLAVGAEPIQASFDVGHPFDTVQTVDLIARVVELPLDWTFVLDRTTVTLGPGEVGQATLVIEPGSDLAKNGRARIAVEGYVNGDLVGGVMVEKELPSLILFADGFE